MTDYLIVKVSGVNYLLSKFVTYAHRTDPEARREVKKNLESDYNLVLENMKPVIEKILRKFELSLTEYSEDLLPEQLYEVPVNDCVLTIAFLKRPDGETLTALREALNKATFL